MTDAGAPRGSVVIAAHDEAESIVGCLEALTSSLSPGELEIVVVCNGCTDDTADLARGFAPLVDVVELDEASKPAALRAGDRHVSAFPRIYLDGDVVLTADDARRLVEVAADGAMVASTELVVDARAATRAHAGYLRIWQRLPSVVDSVAGRGVYVLSEAGRRRFEEFPDMTNDDAWVDSLFDATERLIVDGAVSTIAPRGGVRELVRRKTRIFDGHQQQRKASTGGSLRTSRSAWIGVVRREPRLVVDVPVYLYVSIISRLCGAVARRSSRSIGWGR